MRILPLELPGGNLYKSKPLARIARALANANRLELIDLLAQGERNVEELANETTLSVASTSHHLQTLRAAHLVTTRKEKLRVYYRLSDPTVFRLIQIIRNVAEQQLAEVNRIVDSYLSNRSALEPLTLNELFARLNDPDLIILDVRPHVEYTQGHIPGARSMPIDELESRLGELPQAQEIVAYCRGPYCVFADEAMDILKQHGHHVQRMQEGYPDWRLTDLPVEIETEDDKGS